MGTERIKAVADAGPLIHRRGTWQHGIHPGRDVREEEV